MILAMCSTIFEQRHSNRLYSPEESWVDLPLYTLCVKHLESSRAHLDLSRLNQMPVLLSRLLTPLLPRLTGLELRLSGLAFDQELCVQPKLGCSFHWMLCFLRIFLHVLSTQTFFLQLSWDNVEQVSLELASQKIDVLCFSVTWDFLCKDLNANV